MRSVSGLIRNIVRRPSRLQADQADVPQHLQVLRHRGLPHLQRLHDVADRAFVTGQEFEDVPPPGFGDGVEGSDVVEARATPQLYIPIWEYVNCQLRAGPRRASASASHPRRSVSGGTFRGTA